MNGRSLFAHLWNATSSPYVQRVRERLRRFVPRWVQRRIFDAKDLTRYVEGDRFARRLPAVVPDHGVTMPQGVTANPLLEYFEANTEGHGIWKWRHYFDIYHRHFARFRGQEVHVVEIGVYGGGSLAMWREYFGPQCHIYGIDIKPECREYEDDQISVFIGDQAQPSFWRDVLRDVPRVDIVIDDGGHEAYQQIASLEALLPAIRPGGVYVCEDVHTTESSFQAYVSGLTRNMNDVAEWKFRPNRVQSRVASVHHYPFVVVIELCVEAPDFVSQKHGTEWPSHADVSDF